jgi:hypothetical protein
LSRTKHRPNKLNILFSRGADIINDLVSKKIQTDRLREESILQKVRNSLERIRQRQKAITDITQPREHYEAIRSGDYYMFDEQMDMDDDLKTMYDASQASSKDFIDGVSGEDHEAESDQEEVNAVIHYSKILLEHFIEFLDRYSHDYRQVSKILTKEKFYLRFEHVDSQKYRKVLLV